MNRLAFSSMSHLRIGGTIGDGRRSSTQVKRTSMTTHSSPWPLALATLTFGCGGSESSDFGDASGSGSSVKPGQDAGPSTDDATVSRDAPDAQVDRRSGG